MTADEKLEVEVAEGFATLMKAPAGRKVINWLLEECHVFHSCHNEVMEGERRIGLKIAAKLNEHPELYIKMLEANLAEERELENVKATNKLQEKDKTDDNEFDEVSD